MDTPDRERIRLSRFFPPRYALFIVVLSCYALPVATFPVWAVYAALGLTRRSLGEVAMFAGTAAAFIFLCQLVVAFSAGLLWLSERLRRRPPGGPISS